MEIIGTDGMPPESPAITMAFFEHLHCQLPYLIYIACIPSKDMKPN
jgi:hypothetical protein